MKKLRIAIAVLVVFASGAIVGGAGTLLYMRTLARHAHDRGPEQHRSATGWFTRELTLSTDQQVVFSNAMVQLRQDMDAARRDAMPRFELASSNFCVRVNPCLNPDQQKKLAELMSRMGRGPGGPGGQNRRDRRESPDADWQPQGTN